MNDKLNILLIEDDKDDAFFIEKMLGGEHAITCVQKLNTGEEYLQKNKYDIVLLDLTLPDSEFYETFYKIGIISKSVPIIVLTGLNDADIGKQAIKQGAVKYLVKGSFDKNTILAGIK